MANIRCPLQEASQISGREAALTTSEGTLHYEELDQIISAAALELLSAGCAGGDRIAVWMPNEWRNIALVMALLRIGAVACPLSTRLPPRSMRAQLDALAARAVITSDGSAPAEVADAAPIWSAARLVSMVRPDGRKVPVCRIRVDQPATILFTSGSGGSPKAVMHSFGNHYYSALGSNRNLRVRSGDRWLLSLPLYHAGGIQILFRCFMGGAAIVVPDVDTSLNDSIARYRPTHVSMVSTQLQRFLRSGGALNGSAPATILLGGGPVGAGLLKEAMETGLHVFLSYGLTEMTSQVATVAPDSAPGKRNTSGRVLSYRDVRVAENGELQVRGKTRFLGYVEGDRLVEPFDSDGWFSTGDMGEVDDDGYLTVHGRRDNLFVSGGENIQPEEIETVLRSVAGVDEALVVAVEDEEFGRRPVAFVKMNQNGGAMEFVECALADGLPRFKIPDAFLPWPEIPDPDLKLDRAWFAEKASAAMRRSEA